ncbi:amino acid transporter-like protein [Teratosphaeria nubilosa]|uniref:Amino acid transporter-like protein n=1 Tax=Teratosphaeria nubilosa TaxID=161662 RepID=A0A6G1LH83_9PEZI|nr:amino acid transporter-like protein [Teratosphaeria nubilosa]
MMATSYNKETAVITSRDDAEYHPEKSSVRSGSIPRKHIGTEADRRDMITLGKKQVLRRNFKFITMLGFGSTVICSWEVILPVFTFVLTDGGTAGLFWGYIAVAIGMMFIYASLAEMASMCPTAGGQYHWVSEFAPPRFQKGLSYLTGWLCACGWQVFLAAVAFMVAGMIQGLTALNHPDYGFEHWHATLLTIALMVFAVVFNTVLAVCLPLVEGCVLILHVAGFFAIFIPLWVLAPRAHPEDVLFTFSNNGGWPTTSIAAMIGLSTPITALIGYDCSVHMSEELQDASANMPKSIMWTVGPNAAFGFLMAVTMIFTLGDAEAVLETPTGQPFIQVFYNSVRSKAGANVMTAIVIIDLTSCCISEVATASRQLWSFARDNGLPASKWLSHVAADWNIPMRAVMVSFVITSLLACINLGSTTALNAINSLGGVSILSSYFVTIACLVWRRLYGAPLPPRRWSLGKWGLPINILALCWIIPMWLFEFFPLAQPVTATNMNWNSVMFVGVLVLAAVYYAVVGRHIYTGPVAQVKREQ